MTYYAHLREVLWRLVHFDCGLDWIGETPRRFVKHTSGYALGDFGKTSLEYGQTSHKLEAGVE